MKKVICLALTLALTLAVGTIALAEEGVSTGDYTGTVSGTYVAGSGAATVYNVDIAWNGLSFTYNDEGAGTWNPATHEYDNVQESNWSASNATITIDNHSNAAVKATASYQADMGFEAVDMTFSNNGTVLPTAEGTAVAEAPSATIGVTPTGVLPESADGGKIGTITLAIEAAE